MRLKYSKRIKNKKMVYGKERKEMKFLNFNYIYDISMTKA